MRHKMSTSLSLCLLSGSLLAQYDGEGPGYVTMPANNPALAVSGVGNNVTQVAQYFMIPHSSLPNGVYYTCMTVQFAGLVGHDLMSGTYNIATNVFTKNADVDGLNGTAAPFQLSVSPDLQVAVFDTDGTSQPSYARRGGPTGPFTLAGSITGVPPGYVDIAIGMIDGKDTVWFVNGGSITAGDFNRTTGAVTNSRIVIRASTAGAHSPTAIIDRTGNARAFVYSEQTGSDSDAWFQSSVEDKNVFSQPPNKQVFDTPGWINNPAAVGGRIVYADSAAPFYALNQQFEICAGSSASVSQNGGTLSFSAFMPPKPTGQPYLGAMLLGQLSSGPILHPFKGSPFSLSTVIISLSGLYDQWRGDLPFSFPVPALPSGILLHGVAVGADLLSGDVYVGNTTFYLTR